MCSPSPVSLSPLFSNAEYKKEHNFFTRAGCQKGSFVRVCCYFVIFTSTFYVFGVYFLSIFSKAGYRLERKLRRPDERFISWIAQPCANGVKYQVLSTRWQHTLVFNVETVLNDWEN